MNGPNVEQAETAFQLLSELDHGLRIDVLGLGTFTFQGFGQRPNPSRLLPGGGVVWPDEAAASLAFGFALFIRNIQKGLEESNGV